jgi:hypothetical protein
MDNSTTTLTSDSHIDCACVIHGDAYSWTYVERLFNMLNRNLTKSVRFHVYTEAERPVPSPMVKHVLPNWGIHGSKRSWWYKLQLFDPSQHSGPMLYFDLDTVIINNIDWICEQPLGWFWAVRDFKYLWRPTHYSINSSIMWWDTCKFAYVWEEFQRKNLQEVMKKYRGDQDYIFNTIKQQNIRYLDSSRIKSWKWECMTGGPDFKRKKHTDADNYNTLITADTDILIFHGQPKPDKMQDPTVNQHWR